MIYCKGKLKVVQFLSWVLETHLWSLREHGQTKTHHVKLQFISDNTPFILSTSEVSVSLENEKKNRMLNNMLCALLWIKLLKTKSKVC